MTVDTNNQHSWGHSSTFASGTSENIPAITPETYTQYANMCNYNYRYAQHLALLQEMQLQMLTARCVAHTRLSEANIQLNTTDSNVAYKEEKNISKENQRKASKNMNHYRYEPYSRQLQITTSNDCENFNSDKTSTKTSHTSSINNSLGLMDSIKRHENPIDLSKKGEKLQFLNTLKSIMESQDKLSTLSKRTNIIQNSVLANEKHQTKESGRQEYKLPSKHDKLEYIAVLKELFEKGHSDTSKKILSSEELGTNSRTSNANQKKFTDILPDQILHEDNAHFKTTNDNERN